MQLRFYVYGSTTTMITLLRNLPNLCYLPAETDNIHIDGHLWQQIIINHLPKLKIFRLYMILHFTDDNNQEQQVDTLLKSFRTRFWLDERQ
ncbi:unnamed protein product, partial [Rotaria sp. Silwood2]